MGGGGENYYAVGRRRSKPIVRRRFVRGKETMYTYRDGRLRVTVKPGELYLEFNLSNA